MAKVGKKQSGKVHSSKIQLRPPIVVILGHVDHGKTTLLDYIRKTHFTKKEAGGITQSIGASIIKTSEGKEITFIDTPGHAAFASMRLRGAKIADIAVLVVAGDDGVKPQTKEALNYIRDASVPFIVAVSKMDLSTASAETVRKQLEKEQVFFEEQGGEVPLIAVSGKTGKGVNELLEMIVLVAELHEVSGDEKVDLEAIIIETSKSKAGPLASVVVRQGTLSVGDEITTDEVTTKVRGLIDYQGERMENVKPGEPAQILGFSDLPRVGSRVWHKKDKKVEPKLKEEKPMQTKIQEDELPVVIKAKNTGALEAVLSNMPEKVVVVDSGVGDVNESDVFMAKSTEANIYAFESKVSKQVKKLAETEGIEIKTYDVIYELFKEIEQILEEDRVVVLGKAKIVKTFPFNKQIVAGCRGMEGKIVKTNKVTLVRGENEIGKVKIISMKKGKLNTDIIKQGEECGILFTPQLEFKIGDMLISVRGKK
jgi:translation initiation factor IF-2